MGTNGKKWFILGLVGTIVGVGGAGNIAMSLLMIANLNRSINASIIALLVLHSLYSEMNSGLDITLLMQMVSMVGRNIRMLAIYRLTFYIGIMAAVVGGILALVGWINNYQQNKSEKY